MKVLGVTVSQEIQDECLARMKKQWFCAQHIQAIAQPFPRINSSIAMRIADRLIQRERKAGNIVRHGMGWIWK